MLDILKKKPEIGAVSLKKVHIELKKLQVGERIIEIAVRLKSEWTAKLVSETPEYPYQQKQMAGQNIK